MTQRAKTCPVCVFYPSNCGYWALNGKKDKGGNKIRLNPELKHNCLDFKKV